MKIIVAGGRDFVPTDDDWFLLRDLLKKHDCTEIVSGHCIDEKGNVRGADLMGERIARRLDIKCVPFPADWNRLGKCAGPVRNMKMAIYADAAILFPGGSGTDDMRKKMKSLRKPILYDKGEK